MPAIGLAMSYAPAMFRESSEWPRLRQWLTGDAPQPLELALETPEKIQEHVTRIQQGVATLREKLKQARPEAIVILASDTGRLFSRAQVPQFCTYLGQELWGSTRFDELGEKAEDDIVTLVCAPELGGFIQRELVAHGFDMNYTGID